MRASTSRALSGVPCVAFEVAHEWEHISWQHNNADGTITALTMPSRPAIKASTMWILCRQFVVPRADRLGSGVNKSRVCLAARSDSGLTRARSAHEEPAAHGFGEARQLAVQESNKPIEKPLRSPPLDLTFPDYQRFPPELSQVPAVFRVATSIILQLRPPELQS